MRLLAQLEALRDGLLADHRRVVGARLHQLERIRRAASALYERCRGELPPETLPALAEAHEQLQNLLAVIQRGLAPAAPLLPRQPAGPSPVEWEG